MYLFGKTLNYVIKAVITLITTLDTVYQRPWHLIGAGPDVQGTCGVRHTGTAATALMMRVPAVSASPTKIC